MPDNTLIVVLPDGTTAERRTLRNYVSAVVYRCTEAEAQAAEEELERAKAAVTPEQRAEWEGLLKTFQERRAEVQQVLEEHRLAVEQWNGGANGGSYPKMPVSKDFMDPYLRAVDQVMKHPIYMLEYVDGMTVGPALVLRAKRKRAEVGQVGVACWNQRLELSHSSAAAERVRHPHREIQVVLTSVKEVKRRVKA